MEALSIVVITGQYPEDETIVLKCVTVSGPQRRVGEGMEIAECRSFALARSRALKALARVTGRRFYMALIGVSQCRLSCPKGLKG